MAHILEGRILKVLEIFELLHLIYVKRAVAGSD